MNQQRRARGVGLALERMLTYATSQPVRLSAEAARACVDIKTTLRNLARGDLAYMDTPTLLKRLEAIEADLPTRAALIARPTAAQLVLILDINEVFISPLRDEAPHPLQAHICDRIFDLAAGRRLKALDTAFSPLYVPLPARNEDGDLVDLTTYMKLGGLEFVAENVHPSSASFGGAMPIGASLWEQAKHWLAINSEAQRTWVMFQHVVPGAELELSDQYRPFVVQRSAGKPFSDGDREALEAALYRRLVEMRTAEARSIW